MTAMPTAQTMTAEEFINLPVPEHGRPWNLVEGEVVVNHPTPLHGKVNTSLVLAIGAWTQAGPGRGEIILPLDVRIDERNVYAPDLLWYAEGRPPRQARQAALADVRPRGRGPLTVHLALRHRREATA